MTGVRDLVIAIVEDESIKNEAVHARTERLVRGPLAEVTGYFPFSSNDSFRTSVVRAVEHLASVPADPRRLLIISAHGEPETGTHLAVGNADEQIVLAEHEGLFAFPFRDLIIFVSACWGGYAANVDLICKASRSAPPFLVGPVVPIRDKHCVLLQNAIIDTLMKAEDPVAALPSCLEKLNEDYRSHYQGNWIRYVAPGADPVPAFGEEGLAASYTGKIKLRIIEIIERGSLRWAVLSNGKMEAEMPAASGRTACHTST